MDMAFDLENTASGRIGNGVRHASVSHPDWSDLLARMVAARQASLCLAKEMLRDAGAEPGSFDGSAAACVAAQAQNRPAVNPNDLGNSKPHGAISSPVAGLSRPGGRG
jgi:hypothetical protein